MTSPDDHRRVPRSVVTPNRLGTPAAPNALADRHSPSSGPEEPELHGEPVDSGPALVIEDVPMRVGEHWVHRTVIRSPPDEMELSESQRRRDRVVEGWVAGLLFAALLTAGGLGFALDGSDDPDPLLQILGGLLVAAGIGVLPLTWILTRRGVT